MPWSMATIRIIWSGSLLRKWGCKSRLALILGVCVPALAVSWVLYQMAGIYIYATESSPLSADAAIVLGAAEYNNKPSPVLKQRIEHAVALYRSGRVKAIIFTGGSGKGSPFQESEVARAYAVERGVPAERTHTERVSRVTYANLEEARDIARKEGLDSFLIVSDPLHMRRAIRMAQDVGLHARPSPTPTSQFKSWRTKGPFLLRETYYFCVYLLGRPFVSSWR